MPTSLHITLGADSFKVDDAADLNFSPEFFRLLTAFVYVASGAQVNPQQADLDSHVARLKQQNLKLKAFIATHTEPP